MCGTPPRVKDGWHTEHWAEPKSCQSRQHWQPKSSHSDNPNLVPCHLILVGKVVYLTTLTTIRCHQDNFWQPQLSKAVKVRTLTTPTFLLIFKPRLSLWQLWQLWRPKSCLHDNILMTLTTLVTIHSCHYDDHFVVSVMTFWRLYDNFPFCVEGEKFKLLRFWRYLAEFVHGKQLKYDIFSFGHEMGSCAKKL